MTDLEQQELGFDRKTGQFYGKITARVIVKISRLYGKNTPRLPQGTTTRLQQGFRKE